jgi:hypothetical protein
VNKSGENRYNITVQYPDKTYTVTSETTFKGFVRTGDGYIYGVNNGGVWGFDECGNEIAKVLMPKPDTDYGWPVVAPNGDVYTWKKSIKYSILKWTWVARPNTSKKTCK